jgi:hypothetical protein
MKVVLYKINPLFSAENLMIERAKSLIFMCVALLYGFFLSQLTDVHFYDFTNYLIYAENSWLIALSYSEGDFLNILSNEPVWLMINAGLGLFLDAEIIVRSIIFFGASSFAWLILRHYSQYFFYLILFVFLPQLIKNYLIHLRQGLAIAVFLYGWFAVNRSSRWLLMGLAPFIHASFFFILILMASAWVMRFFRFGPDLRTITYVVAGVSFSLGLGVLAEFFGARQGGQYAFERTEVSGLGFVLWAMILGIMLSSDKSWLREHVFESGIITFYLVTYWLIEVTARIFESGLIVVLVAGLSLRGWRRQAFLSIILGAGALSWVLRFDKPAFGFASVN